MIRRSLRSLGGCALLLAIAGCGLPEPTAAGPPSSAVVPTALPTRAPGLVELTPDVLAEAIAVRKRFGLRADEAWIRRVTADPASQPGLDEFGIALTPGELADLMSRRWDNDLFNRVRNYGLAFPHDFAGAFINLAGSGVVIQFADRVEQHRRALANLVADPRLVEVRAVEWSYEDLDRFAALVSGEGPWFGSIGASLDKVTTDMEANAVRVEVFGATDPTAAIRQRFGSPTWLAVDWQGLDQWLGPRANLVIRVRDHGGRPVFNVECQVRPVDPALQRPFVDALYTSNRQGECLMKNVPAVEYDITILGRESGSPVLGHLRTMLGANGTSASIEVP